MGQSLDRYNLHLVFTWWPQDTKAYLWSMVRSLLFKKRYTAIRVIKSFMIDFFKTGLVTSSTDTQCRCRCRCRDGDTATTVMYAQLTAYIAAQRQTTRVPSLFFFLKLCIDILVITCLSFVPINWIGLLRTHLTSHESGSQKLMLPVSLGPFFARRNNYSWSSSTYPCLGVCWLYVVKIPFHVITVYLLYSSEILGTKKKKKKPEIINSYTT